MDTDSYSDGKSPAQRRERIENVTFQILIVLRSCQKEIPAGIEKCFHLFY